MWGTSASKGVKKIHRNHSLSGGPDRLLGASNAKAKAINSKHRSPGKRSLVPIWHCSYIIYLLLGYGWQSQAVTLFLLALVFLSQHIGLKGHQYQGLPEDYSHCFPHQYQLTGLQL